MFNSETFPKQVQFLEQYGGRLWTNYIMKWKTKI